MPSNKHCRYRCDVLLRKASWRRDRGSNHVHDADRRTDPGFDEGTDRASLKLPEQEDVAEHFLFAELVSRARRFRGCGRSVSASPSDGLRDLDRDSFDKTVGWRYEPVRTTDSRPPMRDLLGAAQL